MGIAIVPSSYFKEGRAVVDLPVRRSASYPASPPSTLHPSHIPLNEVRLLVKDMNIPLSQENTEHCLSI